MHPAPRAVAPACVLADLWLDGAQHEPLHPAGPAGAPPISTSPPRPVTLALQGGGSLGAFTWGVLDVLLDAPGLRVEAVSGTSAGALNGALLVQGLASGGPAEARRLLERLWRSLATGWHGLGPAGADWLDSVLGAAAGALRQVTAPLGLPPALLGGNPLSGVLHGLADPSAFGRPGVPTLVVAATRVRDGQARLFHDAEVTAEILLASACLPQLFPAVEIDGDAYWDGGYSSNPPIRPLIEAGAPSDVIVVRTTPEQRLELPRDPVSVYERLNELAFDAALRQELRSITAAQQLLGELGELPPGPLARLRAARLHLIGADEAFRALPRGSYLDTSWDFLQRMHALGRSTAERWLAANLDAVGVRSTLA